MKPKSRAIVELLDSITEGIAKEELEHDKEVKRHTKELARLRTAMGKIRAHLYCENEGVGEHCGACKHGIVIKDIEKHLKGNKP
jgi:hypothetical protein